VSRTVPAAVGAVVAAFLASLCCVGPLLFVALGVGAGLASTFEPLRPAFTTLTVALLVVGFYVVYGRRRAATMPPAAATPASAMVSSSCASGEACAAPRDSTRDKVLLWVATVVALVFLTFPQWSLYLV
jgi:mercuric ion transport protein